MPSIVGLPYNSYHRLFRPDICGSGSEDEHTSTMGIVQALVSVFMRCINAGPLTITFLLRSPVYYVCASTWGEPESVTRSHLE
ncbi:hypothetical protein EV363DRAFT_1348712 [Boletus edulis]|uniref:Uncharacterized protein n=1 Tax=Boletus edulis BED1 TaxID=1328754 RepID=A0AAD4BMM9_BOLED|nr:hypothetical protein EV363DRAFT_1348712 [Boletus edulis]KAF8434843.1 hypothetical protein L210DRAFT_3552645 [Boletus edulis BED1]